MKKLLFLIVVFLSFSNVKASFIDKFVEQEDPSKRPLISALLSRFDEILADSSADIIPALQSIRDEYNTGYDFGDDQTNKKSLYNWLVYSRSLYALKKLGSTQDDLKLREEFDRSRRHLPIIDLYTDGRDYRYCLSGIWCEVATFDLQERNNLLSALEKGEQVPHSESLIHFFQRYNFRYD